VHVLDDGFQHFRLARYVDLLLVRPDDLRSGRLLPAGRLREPADAARAASALLVTGGTVVEVAAIADTLGIARRFEVHRRLTVPRMVEPYGSPPRQPRSAPALAVAGIARPEGFFEDLVAGGWHLVARVPFPDHHRYSPTDVRAVADRAKATGAALVLTTEKDVVRWLPLAPLPFSLAWVPVEAAVEPAGEFREWLLGRVEEARASAAVPARPLVPQS
jgi:tetraacyldisaccharide 4'-kinase